MKKRIALVLVMTSLLVALSGCGDKTEENPGSSTGTESSVENSTEADAGSGEVTFNSDYKGLNIAYAKKAAVTDDEVLELALATYNQYTTTGSADNTVVDNGETVNIDFVGKQDGVAFEGGTAEGYSLGIGSGSFIAGFEEGLVGVKVGETVDLNLNFPDPYDPNPDLSGAPVVFTVTVNFIYAQTVEDMQDAEVEAFTSGDYTTVDDFMGYCREYLEMNATYQYDMGRERAVITALEGIATVSSLSQEKLDEYTASITNSLNQEAAMYGVDIETYCMYFMNGMDSATYIQNSAEASTRQHMILHAVAEKENLTVTTDEVVQYIAELAEKQGVDAASINKTEVEEYLIFQKVVDFVCENGTVTEQ